MTLYTAIPQDEFDARIARVFATPIGAELLAWMDQGWVAEAPAINASIARARERWSTGGPLRTL